MLWNYVSNEITKVLANSIEVLTCEFNDDGSKLFFTLALEDDDRRYRYFESFTIDFPVKKAVYSYTLFETSREPYSEEVYLTYKNTVDKQAEKKFARLFGLC